MISRILNFVAGWIRTANSKPARASDPVYERWGDESIEINIDATIDGARVGRIASEIDGRRLLICSLEVDEERRGKGVGKELLDRVLQIADGMAIVEARGSVMQKDIDAQPHLLPWYERRGFVVLDPDGECLPGTAKKIVRNRP